jgi:hypothetical protein
MGGEGQTAATLTGGGGTTGPGAMTPGTAPGTAPGKAPDKAEALQS